ncbi:hypothetical protein [Streptomyces sp. SP18CS02]|uniref:hypothetical protein n=1 Tax=Streptomyces sp. SP18CS02 TaxID=3002531 RepID=UPI002E780BC5|nr:hypothetical protein [Streptomyces sp. SP18CS02]MEE1753690.1 hypothetical protein [Streptomyces sp. SP18CS02]
MTRKRSASVATVAAVLVLGGLVVGASGTSAKPGTSPEPGTGSIGQARTVVVAAPQAAQLMW